MRKLSAQKNDDGSVSLTIDGQLTKIAAKPLPKQLRDDLVGQHNFTEDDIDHLKQRFTRNVVKGTDLSDNEKRIAVELMAEQL